LPDSEIGWISKVDYQEDFNMTDWKSDSTYQVSYQTHTDGFRAYGDVNSDKGKILFVGDSYTQSAEVNNAETFYSIIGDSLDMEVFAYGQAGYGTIQEALIIEQYLETIKPDLVILQICDNDYIDNYAPLEEHSNYKVGLRRPYYSDDGVINYRVAGKSRWQEVTDKSRLLRVIRLKLNQSVLKYDGPSAQELMATKGREYAEYDQAVNLTEAIFGRIKKSVGDTPLLIFSASVYEPMLTDMRKSIDKHNILFTDGPGRIIEKNKFQRPRINSSDGYHWNRHGQEMVADTLLPYIRQVLPAE
jgi:hypothetical protein